MPATAKTYELEGQLLEACSCNTPCPCWIGEDPDGGICKSFLAYHFDRGEIQGIDVSGQTLVKIVYIPGNVLAGNWRAVIYLDENSSPEQRRVLLDVITGELGGPLADLAKTGQREPGCPRCTHRIPCPRRGRHDQDWRHPERRNGSLSQRGRQTDQACG
jgi:hypothetical protein